MKFPIKTTIGFLSIGTIAGICYSSISTPKEGTTIDKLIKEKYDYILLDTSNSDKENDKWTEKLRIYKDNKNIFNLKTWKNDTELKARLKEKCKELATKTIYDKGKKDYEMVTKYCARGVTILEQAAKDGLNIINTNDSTRTSSAWGKKYNQRQKLSTEIKKIGLVATDFTSFDIETYCGKTKDQNKQIENYIEIYEAYKKVCTEE